MTRDYHCYSRSAPDPVWTEYGRLFLFATLLSYVPLLLSAKGRSLYPYSGLMSLLFATLYIGVAAEAWIAARAPWLIALLVAGFVALSPLTYGLVASAWYWQMLPWTLLP